MPDPRTSELMQAVSAYKQLALAELGPEQTQEGVRLLKELNRRLQCRNLLTATLAEIRNAGTLLFSEGESREASRFLSTELRRFYAVALEQGLVSVNPLSGEARPEAAPTPEADAALPAESGEQVAAETARLAAAVIEEGIQAGFTLSPLALPLAEMGGRGGILGRLAAAFAAAWSELARHLRPLLVLVRVAVPVLVLILVISAVFGDRSPLSTSLGEATATGNAIRDLSFVVQSMRSEMRDLESASSLQDLGRRVGVNTEAASRIFELQRVLTSPPTLYVRHRESGALVVITEEVRGSLRGGTWRVRR